ncbi:MAG: serine hydroxymethyltransferase [Candidatus Babeliales bacterium]|nr:serine hydroxymethyltransferase [Candidatus Babeliales bacterium]
MKLSNIDNQIFELINKEKIRQKTEINLIASENYVDDSVLEATGSILTNKYAEGYPGKRYYAGCQFVDEIEQLAIDRCKELFNVEHANVQPHAGSQANMAAYFALLEPGDTIMGMQLAQGGHLTHGHNVNFSGKVYKSVSYGVDPETEQINYDLLEELAYDFKPKIIIAGASAYSRTIDFFKFARIAKLTGAYLMCDIAHIAGLIAAGLHPNPAEHADIITSTTHKTLRGPRSGLIMSKAEHASKIDKAVFPGMQGGPFMHIIAAKAVAFKLAMQPSFIEYQKQVIKNAQHMAQTFTQLGYRIVSGGTDNHLFMVDLRSKKLTGKVVTEILEKVGIYVNKNAIPFDPEKPTITSGIRIGTPAITTRGFKEKECEEIVYLIHETLENKDNIQKIEVIKNKVNDLCNRFN